MNIVSWSGGKDSTATIILAHQHNIPIDRIIFAEVMFDKKKGISGELPEHMNFVKKVAIPIFTEWGYEVGILHSDKDYLDCFNHVVTKSKKPNRNGKRNGFPIVGRCLINGECKLAPIHKVLKNHGGCMDLNENGSPNVVAWQELPEVYLGKNSNLKQ